VPLPDPREEFSTREEIEDAPPKGKKEDAPRDRYEIEKEL